MFLFGGQTEDDALKSSLGSFISEEAQLDGQELADKLLWVTKITQSLQDNFLRRRTLIDGTETISSFVLIGSCVEGHKVVDTNGIDVNAIFGFVNHKWTLIVSADGEIELITFENEDSEADLKALLDMGILIIEEQRYKMVPEVFRNLVTNAISQELEEQDYGITFTIVESKPLLKIDIRSDGRTSTLNIRPTLNVGKMETRGSWFWSKNSIAESWYQPLGDGWRRCYHVLELAHMTVLATPKLEMLRALKALAHPSKRSPLSKLDSYTYKNFILAINTATFWSSKDRAHSFKQTLLQLKNHLSQGTIPHFQAPATNLLKDLDSSSLVFLHNYLKDVMEDGSYVELLDANRTKKPPEDLFFEENLELQRFERGSMPMQDPSFVVEYRQFESAISIFLKEYFDSEEVFQRTRLKYLNMFTKSYLSDEIRLIYEGQLRPDLFLTFDLNPDVWQPNQQQDTKEQIGTKPYSIIRLDSNRGNTQAKRYGGERESPDRFDSEKLYRIIRREVVKAFESRSEISGFKVRVGPGTGHFRYISVVANHQGSSHDTLNISLYPAVCCSKNDLLLYSMGRYSDPSEWRKSWHGSIRSKVCAMDRVDEGSRKRVLQILLALKASTPLQALDDIVFVTIVLKSQSKHWWSEGNLAKMLNQVLDRLWVALIRRTLYKTLDKDVNLMQHYDSETFERFKGYLGRYKTEDGFKLDLLFNDVNNDR